MQQQEEYITTILPILERKSLSWVCLSLMGITGSTQREMKTLESFL